MFWGKLHGNNENLQCLKLPPNMLRWMHICRESWRSLKTKPLSRWKLGFQGFASNVKNCTCVLFNSRHVAILEAHGSILHLLLLDKLPDCSKDHGWGHSRVSLQSSLCHGLQACLNRKGLTLNSEMASWVDPWWLGSHFYSWTWISMGQSNSMFYPKLLSYL